MSVGKNEPKFKEKKISLPEFVKMIELKIPRLYYKGSNEILIVRYGLSIVGNVILNKIHKLQ